MKQSDTSSAEEAADDFLPVGMLNNGHASVQMMQTIAMRKMALQGGESWEPFHYEKISATEFELTGAVPLITGNNRKWLEPHTTVIVSEDEIAQGLQDAAQSSTVTTTSEDRATEARLIDQQAISAVALAGSRPAAHHPVTGGNAAQASNANVDVDATHMVVTLRLPDDVEGKRRLLAALRVGSDFFGATVTATVTGRDGAA